MRNVSAFILAGGQGRRLDLLAHHRAKPAVPFGGIYRIIDFALSSLMHAGIGRVGILTQYRPFSLMTHIGDGRHWDLSGLRRSARILPPYIGAHDQDWYRGTADAVYQNLNFASNHHSELVLIVSGDHIYRMDFTDMVRHHRRTKADLTVATLEVPWKEASRFGLMITDDDQRVTDFVEKPENPPSNKASMGIYLFNRHVLADALSDSISHGGFDFGHNVVPKLVAEKRVFAYNFRGYWRDVGTIDSYWQTHMDLLDSDNELDLKRWRVRTNLRYANVNDRPPASFGPRSQCLNSIISRGAVADGHIERSILSPGVVVEAGATVIDSILLHDTVVEAGTRIERCIVDKRATIGRDSVIGVGDCVPNERLPDILSSGLTVIGGNVRIGSGSTIGTNVLLYPALEVQSGSRIPSGFSSTI